MAQNDKKKYYLQRNLEVALAVPKTGPFAFSWCTHIVTKSPGVDPSGQFWHMSLLKYLNLPTAPNVTIDETIGADLIVNVNRMLSVDIHTLTEAEKDGNTSTR